MRILNEKIMKNQKKIDYLNQIRNDYLYIKKF